MVCSSLLYTDAVSLNVAKVLACQRSFLFGILNIATEGVVAISCQAGRPDQLLAKVANCTPGLSHFGFCSVSHCQSLHLCYPVKRCRPGISLRPPTHYVCLILPQELYMERGNCRVSGPSTAITAGEIPRAKLENSPEARQ